MDRKPAIALAAAVGRRHYAIELAQEAERRGVTPGRPIADVKRFVSQLRASAQNLGGLPPIVLATLRTGMVKLASEIAEGAIWANGARSHLPASLSHLTPEQRASDDFYI